MHGETLHAFADNTQLYICTVTTKTLR